MESVRFCNSRARHSNNVWLLMAIPVVIVAFFTYLNRNFQLDDALIYLRYVRNVLEGNGLTYNVGENFNGLTSQLNSYLILLTAWITGKYQLSFIMLSGLFMAGACLVGGKLFARSPFETIFTACVIGSTGYFYSTFGMETTLFLFLIGLSLYLYKIESTWFVIALAALTITRSEGVFLCTVLGIDYLLRHRRLPNLRYIVIALFIIGGPFLFNYLYYGELLPVTGSAKIGQGQSGLWGENWIFLNLSYFIPSFLGGSKVAAMVYTALSGYGFSTLMQNRIAILVLVFNLLLATFYIGLNIPNYHWYYAPFVYFGLIFSCRGLAELFIISINKRTFKIVALCIFVCMCFGYAFTKSVSLDERSANQDYVNIGKWLKRNTAADDSVAMVEIGTVGWYSERPIVDILGLVNAHNAGYIGQRNFSAWLMHYQPDYILRHNPIWGHEQSITQLEAKGMYLPVRNFPFQNYALLERSSTVSTASIKQYASDLTTSLNALRELKASTNLDASKVSIDPAGLFAHAPIALHLTVHELANTLEVDYGIREAAHGLHSQICFQIKRSNSTKLLMNHCIEPNVAIENMVQHSSISAPFTSGEQLTFEISCPLSCDYGFSYWSQVKFDYND